MAEASNVSECLENVLQDLLKLQEQNSDVLETLRNLPDTIKNQLNKHEEKLVVSMEKEFSQHRRNIKNQLNKQEEKIIDSIKKEPSQHRQNEQNYEDLKKAIENGNTKIKDQISKQEEKLVETMRKELSQHLNNERNDEDLEKELENANKKVVLLTRQLEEARMFTQQLAITTQLEEYDRTKKWRNLRRALENVLDKESAAYEQLQDYEYDDREPMWHIGTDGYTELVTVLLAGGVGANISDKDNCTLLHGASYGGHLHLLEMLLDHGADIEAAAGLYDKTPLAYTAAANNLEALKLLLRRGAVVDSVTYDGGTNLHQAVWSGNVEIARTLIEFGADTTAKNDDGLSPLAYAEKLNKTAMIHYLSSLPH